MQPGKLFSVITPCFNRAHLIAQTLDSVKAQTYRPIEIVIVDDGSKDSTQTLVADWIAKNSETDTLSIKYIHQENLGASAARNRGIEAISGEFVQFLDSDDTIANWRLQTLVDTFESEDSDFIITGFDGFDAVSGETNEWHYGKPEKNQLELALRGTLWGNTLRVALTTELVRATGHWNTHMNCFEDREYVERALVLASNPIALKEISASARRGGENRVSDLQRSYEGRDFRILCEEKLAEGIELHHKVSREAKMAFASRLYGLAFRSSASGWPDHAERCAKLAQSLGTDLDRLGKRRRLIYRAGPVAARLYGMAHTIKQRIRQTAQQIIRH